MSDSATHHGVEQRKYGAYGRAIIDSVAWPIGPGPVPPTTRPACLIAELVRQGVVDPKYARWHHGRSASTTSSTRAHVIAGTKGRQFDKQSGSLAVLSPVFGFPTNFRAVWIDCYDDWSIAPDISPPYRLCASRGYRRIKNGELAGAVTVNSIYMAKKLGLPMTSIVPNGTSAELAMIPQSGDETSRLIVLGHFFSGRTDYKLLAELAGSGAFEEIVIGRPGVDKKTAQLLKSLHSMANIKLRAFDWLSPKDIGEICGTQTVAAIPHVVTDYTISQDLMKAYQLHALGLPIICPAPLWPCTVSKDFAFLTGPGVDLSGEHLRDWIARERPTLDWRSYFVQQHSWSQRARAVAEVIDEWTL